MVDSLKYIRGDVVKIKLQEKWVEGFIDKSNAKDKSYSVSIQDYAAYNVDEQLHDISEDKIQPLFLTKDVEFLLAEGYNRQEVFQSLDSAHGDLDDALLYLHRHDRSEGISEQESCSLQRSSEMSGGPASNSTSQTSSGGLPSSSIKEFTPSVKQLEAEANRAAGNLQVQQHSISAAYRKTSFCDDVREKRKITMRPRDDEFDYTIVFQTIPLGFEIHPCANNKNACVGNTLNEFSQENVYKGSLILDCNDVWLLGQSTIYIQQCIKAEAQTLPISITFRAKKWMTSERARNLRLRLEKSRTKRAKSFVKPRKKVNTQKLHERSKTENYLSPSSCTMTSQHTRKVVRVRLPPSQRRKRMKKVALHPELRLLIIGGKTEFGITHVTASIKNLETLTTKKYNPSRTPCFGENLSWEKFKQEAVSSLSIKAMSQDKVVGIGKISIPILPCTINHSVELTSTTGITVGNLSVKVTHIR